MPHCEANTGYVSGWSGIVGAWVGVSEPANLCIVGLRERETISEYQILHRPNTLSVRLTFTALVHISSHHTYTLANYSPTGNYSGHLWTYEFDSLILLVRQQGRHVVCIALAATISEDSPMAT